MKFEYFKNHKAFMLWLMDNGVDIHLNKTLATSRYTFVTNDGKQYFHKRFCDMIDTLNKMLHSVKIDAAKSQVKGVSHYKVILQGDDNGVQKVQKQEQKEVIEEKEEVNSEVEPKDSEVVAEDSGDDSKTIDLDYAKSIGEDESLSKTEAKSKLEEYAREFGYELDKRSKFENMIVELEELL